MVRTVWEHSEKKSWAEQVRDWLGQLKPRGGRCRAEAVWLICHEHTSIPLSMQDMAPLTG